MVENWLAKHDVPLNARGRKVATAIEYIVGLVLFISLISFAGAIEVGKITIWGK